MQRFKGILCVAGGADSASRTALERTAALANNNQVRLTVLEVINKIPSNIYSD